MRTKITFFSRAILSIRRNLKKSMLLFFIVVLLGTVTSAAISTSRGIQHTAHNLEESMLPVVTFCIDHRLHEEFLWETGEEPEGIWWKLTLDILREIGSLPYVRAFDYSSETGLFNSDLIRYQIIPIEECDFANQWLCPELGRAFSLRGVRQPQFIDLEEGLIELLSGRTFTDEEINTASNTVLVSQEFANLNALTLGSTFTLKHYIFDFSHFGYVYVGNPAIKENVVYEISYDLHIVGIFQPTAPLPNNWEHGGREVDRLENLHNRIFLPNRFIESIDADANRLLGMERPEEDLPPEHTVHSSHLFALESAHYLPDFKLAVAEMVPPYFVVFDANEGFRDIAATLDFMRGLAATILWVSMGASLLILTLLILLFIRDRQREIGIYLALGEKRSKIVGQIIIEIICVSSLAIIVSLFIGNILAANVSHMLLINDLAAQEAPVDYWSFNPLDEIGFTGLTGDATVDRIVASYRTALDVPAILLFWGISLGTTLLATVLPILYLLRLNPKRIML